MIFQFLLFILFIVIIWNYVRDNNKLCRVGNIPNVSGIPLVGGLFALLRLRPDNLHIKFQEYVNHFGKSFCTIIAGNLIVVTADVRYVEPLLNSRRHIRKNIVYLLLRSWLGEGLLLSYDQKWQTMRKIITPTFHFKILEQFVNVFDQQTKVFVRKLDQYADGQTPLDIYPYVGLLTLDIIAETAMGVRIDAQVNENSDFVQAVKDVTGIVSMRFVRPHLAFRQLFRLVEPKLYNKQIEGTAIMHRFTENIIELRREVLQANASTSPSETQHKSDFCIRECKALLDVLLQATIDGQPLTDTQIRDEVNTFMFEGHDTTTTAISFCLYLLARHADCQQKLFEEIRAHFGDELEVDISYADLSQLTYLNCVVKEALRLFPPIPAIGRWLKEEITIDDICLPAGTNVIILLWQLLRDESIFPVPEDFQPERHLTLDYSTEQSFINIPFSAGPRNCIGQRFALLEVKTVVVHMLRHFELLPLGPIVQPTIEIVLRSKVGVKLGLQRRVY